MPVHLSREQPRPNSTTELPNLLGPAVVSRVGLLIAAILLTGCAKTILDARPSVVSIAGNAETVVATWAAVKCGDGAAYGIVPEHVWQVAAPTGALPFEPSYVNKEVDLVVFPAPPEIPPLRVADRAPQIGETIWLVHSPDSLDRLAQRGVVAGYDKEHMIASFAVFWGSSGGVVLNKHMEAAGVVVQMRASFRFGFPLPVAGIAFVVPVPVIRAALRSVHPPCFDEPNNGGILWQS